jgi:hypothetical protein
MDKLVVRHWLLIFQKFIKVSIPTTGVTAPEPIMGPPLYGTKGSDVPNINNIGIARLGLHLPNNVVSIILAKLAIAANL